MYAILTVKLHFPPDYVLDRMELYEVKAIMDYQYLAYKEGWEQARLIAFVIALTNSKKKLKLNDIIKFHWESENKKVSNPSSTSMSNEELERLQNKAKEYLINEMI